MNTYIEVRIKACTGGYNLLQCATGDAARDQRDAAQIASIISMLVRTGRPVYQFRLGAPADWFIGFGDNAHVSEVKVSRVVVVESYTDRLDREQVMSNPLTMRNTLQRHTWECEHAAVLS